MDNTAQQKQKPAEANKEQAPKPWYKSWWFIVLVALVLLGLAWYLIK